MIYIPIGFAALTESMGFSCKATDYYCPQGERMIAWNDPELNIPWLVSVGNAIVSAKDQLDSTFSDAEVIP